MSLDEQGAGRRRIAAVALALAALATAGCGDAEEPEPATGSPAGQETDAASPAPGGATETAPGLAYDGPYDAAFREELAGYAGQQVRLRGEVGDLIRSRSAYVLTAPGAPEPAPLLVSARYAVPEIGTGDVVEVTGTVREAFQPPVVEGAAGDEGEEEFYAEHAGEPYLDEATVERSS